MQLRQCMWQVLGGFVDLIHALAMAIWVIGLPVMFIRHWPRARRVFGIYAIVFVIVSQLSQFILGECFFTTIARWCWLHPSLWGTPGSAADEWFTVRVSEAIFHLRPSHRSITLVSEALIVVTAVGVLVSSHRERQARRRRAATAAAAATPAQPLQLSAASVAVTGARG